MQRLLEIDQNLTKQLQLPPETPAWIRRFLDIVAHTADWWLWTIIPLIISLLNPAWKTRMLALAAGVFGLALIITLIKTLARRARPDPVDSAALLKIDAHSFPSGHAARVVFLAIIAFLFGWPFLGILGLLWTVLVSYSRMVTGHHYLTDVIFGLVIGVIAALAFWKLILMML